MNLIKQIPYVTPIIGHIKFGGVVVNAGTEIPFMKDHFCVTELFKINGEWAPHILNTKLIDNLPKSANERLSSIPVKVIYANPDLNTTERYEAFDETTNKLVCAGDGCKAQHLNSKNEIEEIDCKSPVNCDIASKHGCSLLTRTLFKIDGQEDELGGFLLRSSGFNSCTTMRVRLEQLFAKFGAALRHIPLKLVLRSKSSLLSNDSIFYYPDIVVVGDDLEVAEQAWKLIAKEKALKIDYEKLEETVLKLRNNSAFTFSADEHIEHERKVNLNSVIQVKGYASTNSTSGFSLRLKDSIDVGDVTPKDVSNENYETEVKKLEKNDSEISLLTVVKKDGDEKKIVPIGKTKRVSPRREKGLQTIVPIPSLS